MRGDVRPFLGVEGFQGIGPQHRFDTAAILRSHG
jgi:hypothetical protein